MATQSSQVIPRRSMFHSQIENSYLFLNIMVEAFTSYLLMQQGETAETVDGVQEEHSR